MQLSEEITRPTEMAEGVTIEKQTTKELELVLQAGATVSLPEMREVHVHGTEKAEGDCSGTKTVHELVCAPMGSFPLVCPDTSVPGPVSHVAACWPSRSCLYDPCPGGNAVSILYVPYGSSVTYLTTCVHGVHLIIFALGALERDRKVSRASAPPE